MFAPFAAISDQHSQRSSTIFIRYSLEVRITIHLLLPENYISILSIKKDVTIAIYSLFQFMYPFEESTLVGRTGLHFLFLPPRSRTAIHPLVRQHE
jgi:hypothetical protein